MSDRAALLEWKCGVAGGRPRDEGCCAWCGEPIVLVDPTDYRRRQRTRHYGDQHETTDRRCLQEFLKSRCWTARDLVELRGDPCCVDCGDVDAFWEADHRVPLHLGGSHDPTNIERRCADCHAAKTRREARARAVLRRTV